jgi:hypothetical protein
MTFRISCCLVGMNASRCRTRLQRWLVLAAAARGVKHYRADRDEQIQNEIYLRSRICLITGSPFWSSHLSLLYHLSLTPFLFLLKFLKTKPHFINTLNLMSLLSKLSKRPPDRREVLATPKCPFAPNRRSFALSIVFQTILDWRTHRPVTHCI